MREFRVLTITAERVYDNEYIDTDGWGGPELGAEFIAVFINGEEVWRPKKPCYYDEDPADVAIDFFKALGGLLD